MTDDMSIEQTEPRLESGTVDNRDNLFNTITGRTNELLLTPDAISIDPHPLLKEMEENHSDKTIKQAVYKDKQSNISYLVESGPLEQPGASYVLIDWLKLGEQKGATPGGWVKVIQYDSGAPPSISGAIEETLSHQQDTLWQNGRARDFYSHNTINYKHKLSDDEIKAIVEGMHGVTIDTELTERTAAYTEFSKAESDFVSAAVDYWHASEGTSIANIQAAKHRFEAAEELWYKRRETYTPPVLEVSDEETEPHIKAHAEIVPLDQERMKATLLDLTDIDLRLKSAGEHGVVTGFSFQEVEKGYVQVEFTTHEGVTFTIVLGDLDIQGNTENIKVRENFIGVRSYKATIAETGRSFDILKPPFLTNKNTIAAMSVKEPDNSSLGDITPADIDNLTDEGMRYLMRKYRSVGRYFPEANIATYPLPLTLIEAYVGFHEQSHAEDTHVADLIQMVGQWDSRKNTDRPRELLRNMSNTILISEDYANTGGIDKAHQLTAGMKKQTQIINNITAMSALTLRSYLQIHRSNLDPALLLSKKDKIYGKKSSDVALLAEKANAAIAANERIPNFMYWENQDDLIKGFVNEKLEKGKQKPTWTSLASTFLRSCIKR